MDLGPHAVFIVTAYAAAIGIVAGLIIWVVLDRRNLTRVLHELDAQGTAHGITHGITRRPERASEEKP